MTVRFPPPPNSTDLNLPIWRDWFFKVSVALNEAYAIATSPAVQGMAHGTFPMSGMNSEVQEGDYDMSTQISFTTIRSGNGNGNGNGGGDAETQLVPIFFFMAEDHDDGYVGPPWTM